MVEAAFLPGALFLISKWYKRDEIRHVYNCSVLSLTMQWLTSRHSLRYTILYCGNLISNAFGQLIAAGVLANMKGTLGHAAWRWLFYSEPASDINKLSSEAR